MLYHPNPDPAHYLTIEKYLAGNSARYFFPQTLAGQTYGDFHWTHETWFYFLNFRKVIGTRQWLTLQPYNRTLEHLPLVGDFETIKPIEHDQFLNILTKNDFFGMEKYEDAYLFQVYWYPYVISEKSDFEIFLNSSSSCIGLGLSILFDLKTTANWT